LTRREAIGISSVAAAAQTMAQTTATGKKVVQNVFGVAGEPGIAYPEATAGIQAVAAQAQLVQKETSCQWVAQREKSFQ
jgi:hypothetical protein